MMMRNRRLMFLLGLAIGVVLMLGREYVAAYRLHVVPGMAGDEIAFVQAVRQARAAWVGAPNDLARVGMRAARGAKLCAVLPGLAGHDWTGRVVSIEPDNFPDYAGRISAHIVIGLGDHVTLSTPAAPLLNLPGAMVEAGTPVYQVAKSLRIGQAVLFSARFFPSGTDCMTETSFTDDGSMTDPVFKMQLLALTALQ
jgi:hypothetical protein